MTLAPPVAPARSGALNSPESPEKAAKESSSVRSDESGDRPGPVAKAAPWPGARRHRRSSGALLFVVIFVAYAAIGMALSLHYQIVDADGPSRVANAGYVLFSRYPHVGAIGFVWNPLPSLVDLPILLFAHAWPPLLTRGQAGTFMSAAFMAGAVWQLRGIINDRGLPALWRWIIIIGFAANPMIILYGGNGMSEASFMFFTLWAVRRLLRWMHSDKVIDLVVAGIALGFNYLTRQESVAAAAAATVLVIGISALRVEKYHWGERFKRGMVDGMVLAFPFAVSFIGWTLASWITTGIAFPAFSSQYGNSSQVSTAGSSIRDFQKVAGGPVEIAIRDIIHLEPSLPVVAIVVMVLAVRRIELESLVPIMIFGGIVLFETAGQVTGVTFPWFRFFLMSVPLTAVLVTQMWPFRGNSVYLDSGSSLSRSPQVIRVMGALGRPLKVLDHPIVTEILRPLRSFTITSRKGVGIGGLCLVLLLAPSLPVTWSAMLNPLIGTQSERLVSRVTGPSQHPVPASPLANNWYIAAYLDRLGLPNGSVLMDTFIGWDIWLADQHRKQFVITSDVDFITALNAPALNQIQYILVSDPAQDGKTDAVNQRYPTLYYTGAGIATLVMSVPQTGDDASWRLYRVNPLP